MKNLTEITVLFTGGADTTTAKATFNPPCPELLKVIAPIADITPDQVLLGVSFGDNEINVTVAQPLNEVMSQVSKDLTSAPFPVNLSFEEGGISMKAFMPAKEEDLIILVRKVMEDQLSNDEMLTLLKELTQ